MTEHPKVDWVPAPDDFDSMNREGWDQYVRFFHEAYDQPSIRTIMKQARECDKGCTLGRGTVANALTPGGNLPTVQTAFWLGCGISGGKALGEQFRNARKAVDTKTRRDVHAQALRSIADLSVFGHPREVRQERAWGKWSWGRRKHRRPKINTLPRIYISNAMLVIALYLMLYLLFH